MKRKVFACILSLALALSLTACGGSMKAESSASVAAPMAPTEEMAEPGYGFNGAYDDAKLESVGQRKLIRRAELQLETTEFDQAVEDLQSLTEQMGGYFEDSTIGSRGASYRWASYVVRVPADKYDLFVNQAGQLCHLTWRNASQEDVSEMYYDTQGRLKTQQIKLERLQELLTQAVNMEDIITIESAISETEQRIDDLSGTLQHYDALVDYATVTIDLNEVYRLSNVEEVPEGFGSRLGSAFSEGLKDFADWVEDLAVALAYSWLWLVVLAVVIIVAVRLMKKKMHLPKLPKLGKKRDKDSEN